LIEHDASEHDLSSGPVMAVVALAAFGITLLVAGGSPLGGSIVDTDGFMRINRILELRTGEVGWWDGFEYRSNAPFGHSMHWTRPLDVLVIVLAALAQPFGDTPSAVEVAALFVGPIIFAAVAAATAWASLPLVGRAGALVAGLGVVLQPALQSYGAVGRVDHHSLIFLCTALLLGLAVRFVLRGSRTVWSSLAGAVAGLGLWVSTEFLLPLGLLLLATAVAWVVAEKPGIQTMRRFSLWLWLSTITALLVERLPDAFSSRDLDRISLVHVVVTTLAGLFWILAGVMRGRSQIQRTAGGLTAAGALGLLLWLMVPSFVAGPFGDVPPALWEAWLGRVAELQPLWPFGENPFRTLYLLGAPVPALGLALVAARRERASAGIWWAIAGALLAVTLLGMYQARFTAFAQLLATLPWAWLASRLIDRIGDSRAPRAQLSRIGAMLVGTAGFLMPVLLAALFITGPIPSAGPIEECSNDELVAVVQRVGGQPAVLTHVDVGPELLYRTDARVIATPYHRNVDGILAARDFLSGDVESARLIASERRLDLVAVCPGRDAAYLGDRRSPTSLFDLLVAGEAPPWLRPIAFDTDLLIFAVDLG
jgi:hypothetical protein